MKKIIIFITAISFVVLLFGSRIVYADCNNIDCVKQQIDEYQQKIKGLQTQANTLSNQIMQFDSQIRLAELKVQQTQNEIALLGGRIDQVQVSLEALTKAFSARAVATYEMSRVDGPAYLILSSDNIGEAVSKFHYLEQIQGYDQGLLQRLQNVQNTYIADKQKSEDLQKQLKDEEDSLNTQRAAKSRLLADTRGSEGVYQKLLAQAEAQLASFSTFTANQGGASLLSNQTSCDDWGCYYNQRDTQWGGLALNGTQYSLASDGCLVTSMAMILTHYGHRSVTPISINSNSDNFASYYPAYLNYVIHVDGVTATRAVASIDSILSSGNPVVVGVRAYGGTHFVVVKSGSNGNYTMHDPFLPNGKNVNFTDHYPIGSIFEVNSVSIN